jgi:hypothetical protein
MKLKKLDRDESKARTNWFDDGVLNDDRVRRVVRGRRSNLHLREYNRGDGDWETFCRAVALLKDFYKPQGGQVAFADSVEHAADICLSLSPHTSRIGALSRTQDVEMLGGLIYAPAMVAWCAVCHVKGATCFEMCKVWDGLEFAQTIVKIACRCFDKLTDSRYTDEDIARMSQQQQ